MPIGTQIMFVMGNLFTKDSLALRPQIHSHGNQCDAAFKKTKIVYLHISTKYGHQGNMQNPSKSATDQQLWGGTYGGMLYDPFLLLRALLAVFDPSEHNLSFRATFHQSPVPEHIK